MVSTSFVAIACSKSDEPKTFDDCILQNSPTAKSPEALALIKSACKGKFPKVFDFDAIAAAAVVSAWREVAQKAEFSSLPNAAKSDVRNQYFDDVVAPRIDAAYVDEARTQFDSFTRQIERTVTPTAAAVRGAQE